MNNTIHYTVDDDGIATLMLDLPGKSMNVLCDTMIDGSLCAMGGLTPNPVLSALRHFKEDFARR